MERKKKKKKKKPNKFFSFFYLQFFIFFPYELVGYHGQYGPPSSSVSACEVLASSWIVF
jgi:hypothetical protein